MEWESGRAMQRQVSGVRCARLWAGLSAALLSVSCVSRQQVLLMQQRMDALETRQVQANSVLENQREEIQKLNTDLEYAERELRRVSSRVECENDKIRDFIKQCEEGSEVCSEEGMANALAFMDTQPYVMLFVRPDEGVKNLNLTRRGLLLATVDPKFWRTSTKFLVLVQPRGETPELHEEARRIGRETYQMLRGEHGVGKRIRIVPHMLPCKLKTEQIAHYRRKYDKPMAGEPTDKEPRLRVWVFRTDC